MWNPSTCDGEYNKMCKIDEYLDTKNCSTGKHLFGNLVLACEGETLNTTETSLDYKKVSCEKISNCLIYKALLLIISLLALVVICISYFSYYYCTIKRIKRNSHYHN